ncbi:MAG: signal peptidase II [Chloroflexi bacterium]|nr:signal peptidase II [Chloroflexota bacterium]
MSSPLVRGRPHWAVFLGLAGIVVVADQLAKAWLVSILAPGVRLDVVGELVRLVHSQNSGALFGLFKDQAGLFGVVSIGVVGLIVWYHRSSGRNLTLSVALGLLLGGALGNLIDRLRLGYVVDFVDLGIGDLRWYTFNVADAAVSGAILLLLLIALLPARTGLAGDQPAPSADDDRPGRAHGRDASVDG